MTHKQIVLQLLSDGKPHSHKEGYRLGVMLHSRVSDLRRDGYTIDQWRQGEHYLYRLRGRLNEPGVTTEEPESPTAPGSLSLFDLPRGAYEEVA